MKKKYQLIILLILVLIGSFVNYYTANLWLSDVGNMFHDNGIITSIPGLFFSFYFILGTIYIVRINTNPKCKKAITLNNLAIAMTFAVIGLIFAILSGCTYYHSFTKPYPFPGYLIISIIAHSLILIAAIVLFVLVCKRMPKDEEKRKIKASFMIYTLVLTLITYAAFNRFGALLWAPDYIEWKTVYLTWPFYTSMLLPLFMLTTIVNEMFGYHRRNKLVGTISALVITILNIILALVVIIIGMSDSRFISVISPVLALERLAALPVEIILQYGSMLVFGIYLTIYRYLNYRKDKKINLESE